MSTIHILSIGNSFSQDAQAYLHDLAKSEGVQLETVNLMIGGCTLERHFRNMHNERKEYNLEIDGHCNTGFMVSMKEALLARNWDYVTLQQASPFSYKEESYEPYILELADYIRKMCPKAKIMLHQTWAYESGSERIHMQGFESYEQMFNEIEHCYQKAAESIAADGIIPSGMAFKNALEMGIPSVHRDGFHAEFGVGRFILALVWYKYITKNEIDSVRYKEFQENIEEEQYRLAIQAVERLGSTL